MNQGNQPTATVEAGGSELGASGVPLACLLHPSEDARHRQTNLIDALSGFREGRRLILPIGEDLAGDTLCRLPSY